MVFHAVYFSPTGTTKTVVGSFVQTLAASMGTDAPIQTHDFTLPGARKTPPSFQPGDVVAMGVPVYAGRVPNVLLTYLNGIEGNGARAVALVLYGNRHFDDALLELSDILTARGFSVVAGGAFIGEHSFSTTLAGGRPDREDMAQIALFGREVAAKLSGTECAGLPPLPGNRPYRPYYVPQDEGGKSTDIRKVKPKTNDDCHDCMLCVDLCPMGSISAADPRVIEGICIKCGACIKGCPSDAKYFDDPDYLRHKRELEIDFAARREPVRFL